ncbi:MAG: DUF2007 domain-containing protein [Alistipes sp.]|nr:DUF2007 domain-containing protein [Alistipes sp.]
MKTVRFYDDIFQAHAAREYLAEQGIPAEVMNENTGFVLPITYANPSMRPYIAVPDSFYEQAMELIGPQPVMGDTCPECGSGNIVMSLPKKTPLVYPLHNGPFNSFGHRGRQPAQSMPV